MNWIDSVKIAVSIAGTLATIAATLWGIAKSAAKVYAEVRETRAELRLLLAGEGKACVEHHGQLEAQGERIEKCEERLDDHDRRILQMAGFAG